VTAEGQTAEERKKPYKPGPTVRARLRREREAQAGGAPEAPPKRGPAPVTKAAQARRSKLEVQVGAMLAQANLGVTIACAIAPGLDPESDPLTAVEIELLAKGITLQAESHAQFKKYLTYLLSVSGSSGLFLVIAAIVAKRMSTHGLLPEQVGAMASLLTMQDPEAIEAQMEALMGGAEETPEAA
jgi:hypothetical protein